MSEAAIFLFAFLAGSGLGALLARAVLSSKIPGLRDDGPSCDRCQKPTRRPYLWLSPRTLWHCADCEKWINSRLFPDQSEPGYDRDEHMAILRAWRANRQTMQAH